MLASFGFIRSASGLSARYVDGDAADKAGAVAGQVIHHVRYLRQLARAAQRRGRGLAVSGPQLVHSDAAGIAQRSLVF